jgi:hypothetical protein
MVNRTSLFTYDYMVLNGLKADQAGNYQGKRRHDPSPAGNEKTMVLNISSPFPTEIAISV